MDELKEGDILEFIYPSTYPDEVSKCYMRCVVRNLRLVYGTPSFDPHWEDGSVSRGWSTDWAFWKRASRLRKPRKRRLGCQHCTRMKCHCSILATE